MNASYRLGCLIVLATFTGAGLLAASRYDPRPAPSAAAQELGNNPLPLGAFQLVERSGRAITNVDLSNRVWIAAFVFTRCTSTCPRITSVLKELRPRLETTAIQLVSFSVDPDHDTPEVLRDYARKHTLEFENWWFLTGPKANVYALILDRFKIPVAESNPEDRAAGAEAVAHSVRLALVDRGNRVVGYFDALNPREVDRLVQRARLLDLEWVADLPSLNAGLNGLSGSLVLTGWLFIRKRRIRGHVVCMALALASSAAFLASYLVYHAYAGSVPFRGVGPIRLVYFTILLSHTVLAAVLVPLILIVVIRALRKNFTAHARIAALTLPIWLYVSLTGVVVYWMLYRMDLSSVAG